MPINTAKKAPYEMDGRVGVGANNLTTLAGGFFLKRTGNIVDKATAPTDRIVGVNDTRAVFASDNQTVAKNTVKYVPKECNEVYEVTIAGGAVTVADEGKFFNISATDVVNGATVATAIATMQLELVRFISATKGEFRIVNL